MDTATTITLTKRDLFYRARSFGAYALAAMLAAASSVQAAIDTTDAAALITDVEAFMVDKAGWALLLGVAFLGVVAVLAVIKLASRFASK